MKGLIIIILLLVNIYFFSILLHKENNPPKPEVVYVETQEAIKEQSPITKLVVEDMTKKAFSKAEDLQTTGFWSHTNSDGTTFSSRVNDRLTNYYGENLYHGICDLRVAFQLWEKSPTHKQILDQNYKYANLLLVPDNTNENLCYAVLHVAY